MARVTRAGGIVAACQWDFEHGLPMLSLLWQGTEAVAPEAVAKQRQQNPRSHGATLEELDTLWRSSDLSDVTTSTLETLAIEVTRGQFSDMLRLWKAGRFKEFHFTLEEEANGSWAVHSWGVGARLRNRR